MNDVACAAEGDGAGNEGAGNLVVEGLGYLRAASAVWTDFSPSDPGITILESLCYALDELAFQAATPAADLLAGGGSGLLPIGKILLPPHRAFSCDPVSVADHRRRLLDRVAGLGNAILEPLPGADGEPTGLYRLGLYVAPPLPGFQLPLEIDEGLISRAMRAFEGGRALGEDLGVVEILRPVPVTVAASLEIESEADPDEVLAEALHRLALWLAPEPARLSLAERIARGDSFEDIFAGPLQRSGFVDEKEFKRPRRRLEADEAGFQLACAPGVAAVERIDIDVGGRPLAPGESVTLQWNECFNLVGFPGGSTIELVTSGRRWEVNPERVERRLEALWRARRARHGIGPELAELQHPGRPIHNVPAPIRPADVLPAIYGVGPNGLPADCGEERRLQAKQLESFLQLFDHLLNQFSQRIAQLPELVRGRSVAGLAGSHPLGWSQPADESETSPPRLPFTIEEAERTADAILALYGEASDLLIPVPPGLSGQWETGWRLLVKRDLIENLGRAGRGRGRGPRYGRGSARAGGGAELRCRLLLGCEISIEEARLPDLVLVDHVLLRESRASAPDEVLQVTALVHAYEEPGYRKAVEEMVRANIPAHLALRLCFVERRALRRFRRLYRAWCRELPWPGPESGDRIRQELLARLAYWARG